MIRKLLAEDRPAVEELLRVGLEEQEIHAAACVPPENKGFFSEELAEHFSGLRTEPDEP